MKEERFIVIMIIAIVIVLLFGCSRKVTDKLSTETDVVENNVSVNNTLSLNNDSIYSQYGSIFTHDWEYEFATTEYSLPDSNGRVHPVSVTTGKYKNVFTKQDSSLVSKSSQSVNYNTHKDTTNTTIYNKTKSTHTSKVSPSVPLWLYVTGAVLVFAIISFVVAWIKKKGFY